MCMCGRPRGQSNQKSTSYYNIETNSNDQLVVSMLVICYCFLDLCECGYSEKVFAKNA